MIAATVLTIVSAASPAGSKQRISITTAKGNGHSFVLTPLTAGPVSGDSGAASACCWTERFVIRDGQSSEINDPLKTYVGARGTFAMRLLINWVNAGHGLTIGTGSWKIVSGTGAYKHLRGTGRIAISWPDALSTWQSSRAEGLVYLGQ